MCWNPNLPVLEKEIEIKLRGDSYILVQRYLKDAPKHGWFLVVDKELYNKHNKDQKQGFYFTVTGGRMLDFAPGRVGKEPRGWESWSNSKLEIFVKENIINFANSMDRLPIFISRDKLLNRQGAE